MPRLPPPQLLFGPYHAPRIRRGERAFCLYRDCDVVITGLSAGRIGWPRCRAFGTHGGGSGLLVDEELARAICSESAKAIRYWWGINVNTMALWRRAFGIGRADTEGSRQLIRAASEAGAARVRGQKLAAHQVSDASSGVDPVPIACRRGEQFVKCGP